ncbi:uncharacterized protein N7515_004501 [Penicillium bovifimosum]|uniref:Uncharacterized protein n=1 Tax=Penicillium bovifimosum TaxID=126998 RepID=A0A9W9H0L6_9EURO|nr:uncharacterized protein N7515_004501 [Penicillium bovifimosum]KAJ5135223.1 hypothetical protein N7515_004501 [Penicillium bovifimosum]
MLEAKTRHVDWSEVDEDTFVRLCEFAYFRNYTPPTFRLVDGRSPAEATKLPKAPVPEPESEPEPEPEPEAAPVDQSPSSKDTTCNEPEIPYTERSIWTGQLRDAFTKDLTISSMQSGNLDYNFTPPKNTSPWEDFTPVFVEQARLYILADKYGIDSLCQLILSKLHQTLKSFKLYDTGITGIIEFVQFVYSNTPPTYGNQIDPMRDLVTRYVVSVIGKIGESECFQDLLEDGGPFVSDFWRTIWSTDGRQAIDLSLLIWIELPSFSLCFYPLSLR